MRFLKYTYNITNVVKLFSIVCSRRSSRGKSISNINVYGNGNGGNKNQAPTVPFSIIPAFFNFYSSRYFAITECSGTSDFHLAIHSQSCSLQLETRTKIAVIFRQAYFCIMISAPVHDLKGSHPNSIASAIFELLSKLGFHIIVITLLWIVKLGYRRYPGRLPCLGFLGICFVRCIHS